MGCWLSFPPSQIQFSHPIFFGPVCPKCSLVHHLKLGVKLKSAGKKDSGGRMKRVVLVCQGLLLFYGHGHGVNIRHRPISEDGQATFFRLYSGRFATKTARTDMECWGEPGRPMLAKIFTYYMMGLPSGFAPTFTCGVGWGSNVRCHVVCTQTYIQMEHGTQRMYHVGIWYATCLSCGVVGHVNVQCHVA